MSSTSTTTTLALSRANNNADWWPISLPARPAGTEFRQAQFISQSLLHTVFGSRQLGEPNRGNEPLLFKTLQTAEHVTKIPITRPDEVAKQRLNALNWATASTTSTTAG